MIYIYILIVCAIFYSSIRIDWEISDNKATNLLIKFIIMSLLLLICYILFIVLGALCKIIGLIIIFLMEALI